MALIKRGNLNRPLTIEELDGNFEYLVGLNSGQGLTGSTGPKGATGSQGSQGVTGNNGITGATGPKGATGNNGITGATGSSANIGLHEVLNNNNSSNIPISIVGSQYSFHASFLEYPYSGYSGFILGNNNDFTIAMEYLNGGLYPILNFNADDSSGLVKFGVKRVYQDINFWLPTDGNSTLPLDNTMCISINGNYADDKGNIEVISDDFLLSKIYRENPYDTDAIVFSGRSTPSIRPITGTGVKYFLDIDVDPDSMYFEQGSLYKEDTSNRVYIDTGVKVEPLVVYHGNSESSKFVWWSKYIQRFRAHNEEIETNSTIGNPIFYSYLNEFKSCLQDNNFVGITASSFSFDYTDINTYSMNNLYAYFDRRFIDMERSLRNMQNQQMVVAIDLVGGDSESYILNHILSGNGISFNTTNQMLNFCYNMRVFNKLTHRTFKEWFKSDMSELYSDVDINNNSTYIQDKINSFFDLIASFTL